MREVIAISTADCRLLFRVLSVDLELRLFRNGSSVPVFDAQAGQPPRDHLLDRSRDYIVRYNNNDAGVGELHFQVLEARNDEVPRFEINLGAIHSPDVIEIQFSMRPDPSTSPPD